MDGKVSCSADGFAVSTAQRARPGYRSEGIEDVACVRVVVIDCGQGKGHDVIFWHHVVQKAVY
jgi:hypothetical protein